MYQRTSNQQGRLCLPHDRGLQAHWVYHVNTAVSPCLIWHHATRANLRERRGARGGEGGVDFVFEHGRGQFKSVSLAGRRILPGYSYIPLEALPTGDMLVWSPVRDHSFEPPPTQLEDIFRKHHQLLFDDAAIVTKITRYTMSFPRNAMLSHHQSVDM